MSKQLILASQSPRRKSLLNQLGYKFETVVADINEDQYSNEDPEHYVVRLAKEKAQHVFDLLANQDNSLVLGSDTCVVCDGRIFGKPNDLADSISMLTSLSGKEHQVLTAIALVSNNTVTFDVVTTRVFFKTLTLDEIEQYWQTKEPQDKAGSYAIQGIAGQFVKSIQGSFSAVVGLPLFECGQLLKQAGLTSVLPMSSE
ncbi:nucleoside triphosphate pyrophosphatase [Colwellia sp. RSH04]|uniref:Maf family protein n=1 Tax=Colwellia sp. RSH04 TaxID=2305464 RepID=UPI000E5840DC|nr:Maf family protein [Colwellia sp. RSH04]RHW76900.1 septum formation inhibitor Maf [Colwellia sp. RSH04]